MAIREIIRMLPCKRKPAPSKVIDDIAAFVE